MRFMVFRARTGEWLDRDLPNVRDFECAEVLSGPGRLSFTVEPEQWSSIAADGLRVLEDWGSVVLAVDEDSWDIVGHGIVVPPTGWEDERVTITCMGVAGYPQGFIYENSRNWGPKTGTGTIEKPEVPRPDPVGIFRDLWDYVQSFPNSDLGVTVTGTERSKARVGDYEEPYRLRWWETPDIGSEMDTLAQQTPFDYRERVYWTDASHTAVRFEVEVGWPRLGKSRDDLAFDLGVNVFEPPTPETVEDFGNNFLGIGNGEGSPRPAGETSGGIVNARLAVDDGRLRRTIVVTDKTIKSTQTLRDLLGFTAATSTVRVRLGEVAVLNHPHAPLSAVNVGDDIYLRSYAPAYGEVNMWVRVIEKARGADPDRALLGVIPAGIYSPATPSDLAAEEDDCVVTMIEYGSAKWSYKQVAATDSTVHATDTVLSWATAAAPFGNASSLSALPAGMPPRVTNWTKDTSLWLRRTIPGVSHNMRISLRVEDHADVWVNGIKVLDTASQGSSGPYWSVTAPLIIDVPDEVLNGRAEVIAIRADDEPTDLGSNDNVYVDVQIEGCPAEVTQPTAVVSGATIGVANFPTSFPTAKAGDLIVIGMDRGSISDPQLVQVGPLQSTVQSEYDYNLRVYVGYLAADGGGITGFSETATGDISWAIYRNATLSETVMARSDTNPTTPLTLAAPQTKRVAAVLNSYNGITGTPALAPGWELLSTWSYTYGRTSQIVANGPAPPFVVYDMQGFAWQVVLLGLD